MVLRDHRERTTTSDPIVRLGLQHHLINVSSTCHRICSTRSSRKLKFPRMCYKGTEPPPLPLHPNPPTETAVAVAVADLWVLGLLPELL